MKRRLHDTPHVAALIMAAFGASLPVIYWLLDRIGL